LAVAKSPADAAEFIFRRKARSRIHDKFDRRRERARVEEKRTKTATP
jgi:hypothetical protein